MRLYGHTKIFIVVNTNLFQVLSKIKLAIFSSIFDTYIHKYIYTYTSCETIKNKD